MHTREARLRQAVLDSLAFEPGLDSRRIGVVVVEGIVTLRGHVPSYAEKTIAENVVKQLRGVRGIAQQIEVRCPAGGDDKEIAERARRVIAWHATLPQNAIEVAVERGRVTLSGEVEWQFQRLAAAQAVRELAGVIDIANLIAIRQGIGAMDIKCQIEAAFKRTAAIDARHIKVEVVGGRVLLAGRIDALHQRDVARRLTWAVPGVTSVEDRLRVG